MSFSCATAWPTIRIQALVAHCSIACEEIATTLSVASTPTSELCDLPVCVLDSLGPSYELAFVHLGFRFFETVVGVPVPGSCIIDNALPSRPVKHGVSAA